MTDARAYIIRRPRWEDVAYPKGILMCSCGATIWSQDAMREHWQAGHFDEVINVGDPDYIEPNMQVVHMEG